MGPKVSSEVRPRVVMVGKHRLGHPVRDDLVRKYALHARFLREVSIHTGRLSMRNVSGVRTISIPVVNPAFLGGMIFYSVAPVVTVAVAMARGRCPIVCQSPYEGFGVILLTRMLPRSLRPRVQVEVHGDWRAASRLYGSHYRRIVSTVADRTAEWTLRRADNVRVVSEYLEQLTREAGYHGPINRYTTYSDYQLFLDTPPKPIPDRPTATFVGVLERYKAIDVLLDAWEAVVAQVPQTRLVVVGEGSLRGSVERRLGSDALGGTVELLEPVPQQELSALLDDSWCLVLPSRSEGLGRVAIEAMARGRAVIASGVGGLQEVVVEGATGRLVPPEDVVALSQALVDVLGDRSVAEELGRNARVGAEARRPVDEYEDGVRRLVRWLKAE